MPADLTDPFAPSCCESGGESGPESCSPCGCDPGLKPTPWVCQRHQTEIMVKELLQRGLDTMDDNFERALFGEPLS